MRLSTHLLAASVAGLVTAYDVCRNPDLSFNATNIDSLVNCTQNYYNCAGEKYVQYQYHPTPPPGDCRKSGFNVFFSDYNMTGPLVIPDVVEINQVSLYGHYPWYLNASALKEEARYLRVDSVEFPDLVNITSSGMIIEYAHNLSSLKVPKLENVRAYLRFDLSGGPAINLSFPSLRDVRYGIVLTGKIDALEMPVLDSAPLINITSTGDLDCIAFAATVVNATRWPTLDKKEPESMVCTSNKNSIKTHPVPPPEEDTSGSSGVSGFRGDLLLLAIVVGCVSLVV